MILSMWICGLVKSVMFGNLSDYLSVRNSSDRRSRLLGNRQISMKFGQDVYIII